MREIPEEAVQACPCVCHGDHPGVEHVRACCPHWDGPLGWHVGESLPHIEARTRRKVAEEIAAAILADADPLIATRTGAAQWEGAYRAARVARLRAALPEETTDA